MSIHLNFKASKPRQFCLVYRYVEMYYFYTHPSQTSGIVLAPQGKPFSHDGLSVIDISTKIEGLSMTGSKMWRGILLCLAICVWANPAWGAPHSYFGVFGGISSGGKFSDFKNESCIDRNDEASTDSALVDFFYLILFGDSSSAENGESRCKEVRRNVRFSGPDTSSSGAWGAKFGLLGNDDEPFESMALEFIYFERYPGVHRQSVSARGPRPTALFNTLPFDGSMEMDLAPMRTFAIMFNILPSLGLDGENFFSRFQVYIGAGFGITYAQINEVRVYNTAGMLVATRGENDGAVGASFPLTVGLDFRVKGNVWLTSQYIFTQAFGLSFDEIDTRADSHTRYFDHLILFGIRFEFGPSAEKSAEPNLE